MNRNHPGHRQHRLVPLLHDAELDRHGPPPARDGRCQVSAEVCVPETCARPRSWIRDERRRVRSVDARRSWWFGGATGAESTNKGVTFFLEAESDGRCCFVTSVDPGDALTRVPCFVEVFDEADRLQSTTLVPPKPPGHRRISGFECSPVDRSPGSQESPHWTFRTSTMSRPAGPRRGTVAPRSELEQSLGGDEGQVTSSRGPDTQHAHAASRPLHRATGRSLAWLWRPCPATSYATPRPRTRTRRTPTAFRSGPSGRQCASSTTRSTGRRSGACSPDACGWPNSRRGSIGSGKPGPLQTA